jgi:glucose-6-phosphate isomerase
MSETKQPTDTAAWPRLASEAERLRGRHLRELVAERGGADLVELGAFACDLSKHKVEAAVWEQLYGLADEMQLEGMRRDLFAGVPINQSEGRAVLHTALRARAGEAVLDGVDLGEQARAIRERMATFVEKVHQGVHLGATGKRLTHLVHVGIGGSELGPKMLVDGMRAQAVRGMEVRFASNIDGGQLEAVLDGLDPEHTLVCVASKTFTTHETMVNASSVRAWLEAGLGDAAKHASKHWVAVTAAPERAEAWGVTREQIFEFWDWVGGRYSLWSSIGFPAVFTAGGEAFEELVAGAREADQHFRTKDWAENLPVRLALLGVWYGAFFGAESHAVIAYDDRLASLPSYLQQADMESNGKSVDRWGARIEAYSTGPIVWGGAGTNGQHAYFQLLHQGTRFVPVDFIVAARPDHGRKEHHDILLANCLAQSQALMEGKDESRVRSDMRQAGSSKEEIERLAAQRSFTGDRPSSTFLLDQLTPRALGNLIATYEHKIFVQGVVWGINSYDQWGVELGKVLALDLLPSVESGVTEGESLDASTHALLARLAAKREPS